MAIQNKKTVDGFFYVVTIRKLHNALVWFDYTNIENCDSMTEEELLNTKVSVHYDVESDLCRCQFLHGGLIFEMKYREGTETDQRHIQDLKKI